MRIIRNPTKVGRDWDNWPKMGGRDGGGGSTRGFWGYTAKAGPKHHLVTTGSCFGARAIVVVVAQDLKAVVAGDLHTTPAWDEMRGADEEARHTLCAPVNYWTDVNFTGHNRWYDLNEKRRGRAGLGGKRNRGRIGRRRRKLCSRGRW